jgi:hypothetical protein
MFFSFSGILGFVEMRMLADDGTGRYVDLGVAAPALVQMFKPDQAPDAYWEAGDADGDGDVDLLVDGGYWRNAGTGYLEALVATDAGRVFDVADFDGDGDPDLLAVAPSGSVEEVRIQRNLGGGSYAAFALGALAGDLVARFVDLDGDGDADVAAADPGGNQLLLAQNNGGVFAAAVLLSAGVRNIRLLGVADLNGDGLTDLLTQRTDAAGAPFSIPIITEHRRTGPGLAYVKAGEYLAPSLSASFDGALDIDGDGDLDMVGKTVMLGQTVMPADSGVIQQFGTGLAGTGGVVPVLGAKGPPTSTGAAGELRLVQAVGGGATWLAFGLNEIALAGAPLPGMTLYVGGPAILGGFPVGGPSGVKGAGSFALPLPKIPALAGITVVSQMFVVDPASPFGWTSTNGLRITFGP